LLIGKSPKSSSLDHAFVILLPLRRLVDDTPHLVKSDRLNAYQTGKAQAIGFCRGDTQRNQTRPLRGFLIIVARLTGTSNHRRMSCQKQPIPVREKTGRLHTHRVRSINAINHGIKTGSRSLDAALLTYKRWLSSKRKLWVVYIKDEDLLSVQFAV